MPINLACYTSFKLNLKYADYGTIQYGAKIQYEKDTNQRKFITFSTIGVRNNEPQITSYLKLKKDD